MTKEEFINRYMQDLEVLDGIILSGENSEVFLQITDPVEGCLLMKELKDGDGEGTQDG